MIHVNRLAYRSGSDLIVSAEHPYACKILATLCYNVYGEPVLSEKCNFNYSKALAEASVL
jgi:hypothetical protein